MHSAGFLTLLLSLPILGQEAPQAAPVPNDPLEMVTDQVPPAAPENQKAVFDLLSLARNNYAVRNAGRGYDLKVSFMVNSGGQTEYDGAWQMEDMFDPRYGHYWTATSASGYAITEISSKGMLYAEATGSHIPLRLQEARATLFDPMPSPAGLAHTAIRTSTAAFRGMQLTCVLLSPSGKALPVASGRHWDETEECIDPQSGLLIVHSQVPGRYYAYDYSNAPQLDGHMLPRKVIITEAGKTVTEISVDSLTELPAADASLFAPNPEMKERGRAIAMAGAQKLVRISPSAAFASGTTAHTICVFGLATPSGELVEAHSLQPSDPLSQAALEDAKQLNFAQPPKPGQVRAAPQQHFVFVIEEFGSSQ